MKNRTFIGTIMVSSVIMASLTGCSLAEKKEPTQEELIIQEEAKKKLEIENALSLEQVLQKTSQQFKQAKILSVHGGYEQTISSEDMNMNFIMEIKTKENLKSNEAHSFALLGGNELEYYVNKKEDFYLKDMEKGNWTLVEDEETKKELWNVQAKTTSIDYLFNALDEMKEHIDFTTNSDHYTLSIKQHGEMTEKTYDYMINMHGINENELSGLSDLEMDFLVVINKYTYEVKKATSTLSFDTYENGEEMNTVLVSSIKSLRYEEVKEIEKPKGVFEK